ncbi:ABC transporter substrate-binding protein [Marinitenerispora sediminis]|uniref:Glycine/betaine ABC transporter substrate-binding protein n=1 Tax=Marinitenerispora sediminis TaxID=1931232 RepID=A0A368TAM7_9ACTN|nr:ABC transporter substrate-binding protein [Marinitenerispora sediminis]RCV50786.1 glycine/betaine ABC transporter substrate-binding protein [Marinitenerispora sediminis]RCV55037.1 glycine/betaine ABC transporter substrate-binding protein [Marinitenerispora sediminis]RCV62076.1 glycine/betaine ABC transporter substrate-binding protein [Marinitenerispora sediminis]
MGTRSARPARPTRPAARRPRGTGLLRTVVLTLVLVLATSCAVRTTSVLRDPDTVRIALNAWVGYEADAAVVGYLLEHELGYQVQLVQIDEQPAWQALDQGAVDVILENWGHEDLMRTYGPEGNGTVVDGGPTGNVGQIGWYLPRYLVEEYPGIDTPEGLREHADVFRTPESGDRGQFLAGAPGFVTSDQGLINHFDLPFEIVFAGSEAAQLTEVRNRYERGDPVLFYSQDPSWVQNDLDLVRVRFPEWTQGCDTDPEDVSCDYPRYELNKVFRAGFARDGGAAYELIRDWTWSNADQNAVAQLIADDRLDPEDAAARWVAEHPDVWRPWIPEEAR